MKVYDGSSWVDAGSAVNGTAERQVYTATASQTVFSSTYDVGFVDVYLNGIKLVSGTDYTATNGTSITLAAGATAGDTVDIVAYGAFNIANTYTQAQADARYVQVGGDTMTGSLGIGTSPNAAATLHLHDTSGTSLWITSNGNNPSDAGSIRMSEQLDGSGAYFELKHDGSNNLLNLYSSNLSQNVTTWNRVSGDISFYDTSGNAKFFWDASAEALGIGTTSPVSTTEIVGTNSGGALDVLNLRNAGGDGSEVSLNLISSTDPNNTAARSTIKSIRSGSSSELALATSNSEALRIDSSGKVGIGVTSMNDATLEIQPSSDIPQIKLTQNNVPDGGDGWKFHASGPTGGNLAIIREASGSDYERMRFHINGSVSF